MGALIVDVLPLLISSLVPTLKRYTDCLKYRLYGLVSLVIGVC
jgi:hypothetical protein